MPTHRRMAHHLTALLLASCLAVAPVIGCGEDDVIEREDAAPEDVDTSDDDGQLADAAQTDAIDTADAPPAGDSDGVQADAAVATSCDAGCSAPTPFCDLAQGVCVACLTSASCDKAGQRCIEGTCVDAEPCISDKACVAKNGVCDPIGGVCVDCLTAVDCGEAEACVAKVCLPAPAACTSSKDCAALNQVCDKAAGVCVDCESDVDCPESRHCVAGLCLPDVCVGGDKTCLDLKSRGVCAASGATFTKTACPAESICKDGSCLATICAPGTKRCEAGMPETCDALGVTWAKGAACGSGSTCLAGSCVPTVCSPGASQCAGDALLTCDGAGLAWTSTACAAASGDDPGQGCAMVDGVATCKAKLCKAGQSICAGQAIATCKADGFGYAPGDDCATKPGGEAGFACKEGACLALKCVPGTKACAGAGVQTCNAAGDGWTGADCATGEGCKDGACKALVCAANAVDCDGSKVRQCDGTGTSPSIVEDCATSAKGCVDGACVPWICEPGSKTCSVDGASVQVCLSNGLGFDTQGCGVGKVCDQAACVQVICAPGKAYCDGAGDAMQCNSNGTKATTIATCNGGKVCQDGACVTPICKPGTVQCQGLKALETCNSSGIAWVPTDCPSGSVCDGAICKAQSCSPNALICKGSEVHACDAKGIGFAKAVDCAASGKVCKDGACATLVCKAGEKACIDGAPATCAADGLGWQKSQCTGGETCKDGGCAKVICAAGAKGCAGTKAQLCDATGTAWQDSIDCATAGDLCDKGACVKPICSAGAARCVGAARETCEGPLLGWKADPCKADEVCLGEGVCTPKLCTPGALSCIGSVASLCGSDGTTLQTVSDCAKDGKVCSQGSCKTTACNKGDIQCKAGNLQVCANDQLSWLDQACPKGSTCTEKSCKDVICTLDAKQCAGSKVQICTTYGTAWSDQGDCAASSKLCKDGACVDKLCVPGATTCSGDLLETCNADALSTTKTACPSGSICDGKGCQPVVCAAGQPYCDGNAVYACNGKGTAGSKSSDCGTGETCKAGQCTKTFCPAKAKICPYPATAATCADDGSKYVLTPCKQGELCHDGACVLQICVPGAIGCSGSNAWVCHASGGYYVATASCGQLGKGCKDGACVDAVCTPGAKSCIDGAVATCKIDAVGYDLATCSDGDGCTSDGCSNGSCVFGASKVCDDSNTCTADSCDKQTGTCVFAPKSGSCDDGTVCTKGDLCVAGSCTATPGGQVATVAGSGVPGFQDGAPTSAKFANPGGMALDVDGKTVLIADASTHRIRSLATDGTVGTFAGSGSPSFQDGAKSSAHFYSPIDLTRGGDGALYVADRSNNRIRRIDASGNVTTVYGTGSASLLSSPTGVAWHPGAGALVVSDFGRRVILLLQLDGKVTTLAGLVNTSGFADGKGDAARFAAPSGVAVDQSGAIWVADQSNHRVRKVTLDGQVTTVFGDGSTSDLDGKLASAKIRSPASVLAGPSGVLVGSERRLRWIVGDEVFTIAGGDSIGYTDGSGTTVKFWLIHGILRRADGSLLLSDHSNHRIRSVTPNLIECDDGKPCTKDVCDSKTGACSYAPLSAGAGCSDGLLCTTSDACDAAGVCAGKATICDDNNVCTDDSCDPGSGKCAFAPNTKGCDDGDKCTDLDRCEGGKCVPGYDLVSTVAGSTAGWVDGKGSASKLNTPFGIAIDSKNLAWIADYGNHRVRTMKSDGTITTRAGTGAGLLDGPLDKAKFNFPAGIAIDAADRVYVSELGNHRIRRLDASDAVITYAGSSLGYLDGPALQAQFKSPAGLSICSDGMTVVADAGNHRIRAISVDGKVTTLAGSGSVGYLDGPASSAQFSSPWDAVCAAGGVYVVDRGNRRIRKVSGGSVTTVAGSGSNGALDGPGSSASFGTPSNAALRVDGTLFVTDEGNHRVRVIAPDGTVSTLFGTGAGSSVDGAANVATIAAPRGIAVTADGGLLAVDGGNHRIRRVQRTAVFCEDGDACGKDSCDAKSGACVHTPVGLGQSCDDGDACTSTTTCSGAGVCAGTGKSCDDGNSCSVDVCDPYSGTCDHPTPFAPCDDGDACTSGEVCWAGTCGSKTPVVSTVAGKVGIGGDVDGDPGTATLNACYGLAFAGDELYFTSAGQRIRTWNRKTGKIVTIAGNGSAGYVDGTAKSARFSTPWGLATDGSKVWIGDTGNHRVRLLQSGIVQTLAGNGSAGYQDGAGWQARFNSLRGLQHDGHGRVVVADYLNHRLRRVTADGVVSTLCGTGKAGYADGPASSAELNAPISLAYDGKGNLVFFDNANWRLRQLSVDGKVTTLAGSGTNGANDGPATSASLGLPYSFVVRPDGAIWMPMAYGSAFSAIRALQDGKVTTLTEASSGHYDGILPYSQWKGGGTATMGPDGAVYAFDFGNYVLRKIAGGPVSCDDGDPCTIDACIAGAGACDHKAAVASAPCDDGDACTSGDACGQGGCTGKAKDCSDSDVCSDDACDPLTGSCSHIANTAPCDDAKVCTEGERCWSGSCHTSAGLVLPLAGVATSGNVDGKGDLARFASVNQLSRAPDGALWFSDTSNHRIGTIGEDGSVKTVLSGSVATDGSLEVASTGSPTALCASHVGLRFFDSSNRYLRRLHGGVVKTIAGDGQNGYVDGPGLQARFGTGMIGVDCVAATGATFVADRGNHRIRLVAADGVVSTLAGSGTAGFVDGPGSSARFNAPRDVAVGPDGSLFVADQGNYRVRKVALDGTVTTIAGAGTAGFIDGATSSAAFGALEGIACDGAGRIFVLDASARRLRWISGGNVATLAGSGASARIVGPASSAAFATLSGIALGKGGDVFVGDGVVVRRVVGLFPACEDGDPCTVGACNAQTGCQQSPAPDGQPCAEGGKLCTTGRTCGSGICGSGKSTSCADKNECTADSCDGQTGLCVFAAIPGCTPSLVCGNGVQQQDEECDDGNEVDNDGCSSQCKLTMLVGSKVANSDDIKRLAGMIPNGPGKFELCYRRSDDGASASTWHSKCDKYSASLVLGAAGPVTTKFAGYLGGPSKASSSYSSGPGSFLVNLYLSKTVYHNLIQPQYAQHNGVGGPTWGGGHDLHIKSDMTTGYSNLGHSYQCVISTYPSDACKSRLLGSADAWKLSELEVWGRVE